MNIPRTVLATGFATWIAQGGLMASSLRQTTESEDVRAAAGICRGRVVSVEAFRHPVHGGIFSRARIQVLEAVKGTFQSEVTVVQRGGTLGGEGESTGLAAPFIAGEERIWLLAYSPDGTLGVHRGAAGALPAGDALSSRLRTRRLRSLRGAEGEVAAKPIVGEDFSSVTGVQQGNSGAPSGATGLLADTSNIPARFVAPDRGEPIPYLVDAAVLPSGITQAQALSAVSKAFAAWTAVTGVQFRFDGLVNFGMSAADVNVADEKIRIQLHDTYNEVAGGDVLGIGGRVYNSVSTHFSSSGGGGGQVKGVEFHRSLRGYVVLEHGAASFQNQTTLAEVLCHEIGHALGLAHSSENPSESNPTLKQALMFFLVHEDGRGASLGSYDVPIVVQVHPPTNTPPYTYDRLVPLVTAPTAITTVPGINELQLAGYDLQTPSASLALITSGPSGGSSATASFSGSTLKVAQTGYYSDSFLDPAGGSFWFEKWVRFSDGVNCSPWKQVKVVSTYSDSKPSPADGLPDSWMQTYFGSATPSAQNLSRAGDDMDGDGFSNLQEFRMGTSPVNALSNLRITAFSAASLRWDSVPYQFYTVESSTNLQSWSRFGSPVVPTGNTAVSDGAFIQAGSGHRFYRIIFGP